MFRLLASTGITSLLIFYCFGEVSAQDAQPSDDEVNTIAKQLYCPVCENVPLDVCGTKACAQWRDDISDKLADGWNEEQIKQYFSDRYGIRVLAHPPTQGFNMLFWLLPPVSIIIAWFLVLRTNHNIFRKKHMYKQSIAKQVRAEEYIGQLENALEQWR